MSDAGEPTDDITRRRLSQVTGQEPDDGLIDEDPPADDGGGALDIGYRGRGRPRLPPDQRRRDKLVVSLTADELKAMMHAAADAEGGPRRLQDWARGVLLAALKTSAFILVLLGDVGCSNPLRGRTGGPTMPCPSVTSSGGGGPGGGPVCEARR